MFGTTGRFSVEFRHDAPGIWEKHQMLNTDDLDMAERALSESVGAVQRLGVRSDVNAIRIFDNQTGCMVGQWNA